MASSSRAAAAAALESLSDPQLASLPAVELVLHLYNNRGGSSFADVALVLAVRERRAADAEERIRAADEAADRLRDEMAARALETEARIRVAAETEARLRAEIRELERKVVDEAAKVAAAIRGVGGGGVHGHGHGVATADGQDGGDEDAWKNRHAQEMKMSGMKAHVAAWEAELCTADSGMSQENGTKHKENIVDDADAQVRSGVLASEHRSLIESKVVIPVTSETEECLKDEIIECKDKAYETEVRLWAEIQARGRAVTDLEAWKHCAMEAQAQIHAASVTEAGLRDEIAACKHIAVEAEARHRAEIKALECKVADAMTRLHDEISMRRHMANEFKAEVESKINALHGYHTAVETGLRTISEGRHFMTEYYQTKVQALNDKITDLLQRQGEEQRE